MAKRPRKIYTQCDFNTLVEASYMTWSMAVESFEQTLIYGKMLSGKFQLKALHISNAYCFILENGLYRPPFPEGYGYTWEGTDKSKPSIH